MGRIKKVATLLITLSMLTMMASCSTKSNNTTSTSSTKKIKIGYTVQTLKNPYFVTVVDGFKAYAKEKDIDVIVADGNQDAATQISQVENFIAEKVDAIAISPVNEASLEDAVNRAHQAGIKVIAVNQEVKGSDAFITVPEYDYGYTIGKVAGQWIKDKLNGTAEVLVLDYPEIDTIIERGNGIREGILEVAPNAKIVKSISANTPEKGMAAMESVLQTNPNVQVVVGVNDAGVLGAYEAVMAAHKQTDNFFMGGLDATDEALRKIKDDTIYRATVDINPKGTGKLIIDTTLDVIKNGPKKDIIKIDMIPVTSENIKDYIK